MYARDICNRFVSEINDRNPVVLLSKIPRSVASSHGGGGDGDLICGKTYGTRISSWFSDPTENVHVEVLL
ncbi:hypothetical protein WN55_00726 [Dufourea novaeangliae]|uniref:Uncharacterized protein n=1 Tax=Dufourea novaeangliae TaxID=178035 RepID=A0A154P0H8_DUFNO|nr:hypothetical protein WN55_00726 [Dufourea novaeangliae]